ncbi:MAG: YqeG family HAD IIIA-type phosphatase [Fusicatenibacter sp.]|nr:YqeG family HAD IIIA-type phosphatase [Fusicatenibacter sp.]
MENGKKRAVTHPGRGIRRFYPDLRRKSAYTIEYEKLYKKGYRGVIFDIDNTLVPHGAPATEEAIRFFEKLHTIGYSTCLLSNNQKPRVEPFASAVDSIYIEDAHKPSRKNYWKACERMGTTKDQTLFVGDQLFTDVYGAKRAGLLNILVEPIHPKEEIQIVLKRYLEKIVLYFYERDQRKSRL